MSRTIYYDEGEQETNISQHFMEVLLRRGAFDKRQRPSFLLSVRRRSRFEILHFLYGKTLPQRLSVGFLRRGAFYKRQCPSFCPSVRRRSRFEILHFL